MTKLKPFNAHVVNGENYQQVIAPPYDVLSVEQASKIAQQSPSSIVHVTRPEVDCKDKAFDDPSCYPQAKKSLKNLLMQHFTYKDTHSFFIYQISKDAIQQTGIVGLLTFDDANQDCLKTHEHTRPKKVADRSQLLQTLEAQISPVLLTIKQSETVKKIEQFLSHCSQQTAANFSINDEQGYRHQVWQVSLEQSEQLSELLAPIENYYIADGHHRCAAALDAQQHQVNKEILSVVFPADRLNILGYHRLLIPKEPQQQPLTTEHIIDKIAEHFTIEKMPQGTLPNQKGEFGLYIDEQWYRIISDKLNQLDITTLHQDIIEPLFNIIDPREDNRIDFIGGDNAINEIENHIDYGHYQLAFTLYPTQIDEVLQVADNNEVMPPKSTWFEPKLRDGFFIY